MSNIRMPLPPIFDSEYCLHLPYPCTYISISPMPDKTSFIHNWVIVYNNLILSGLNPMWDYFEACKVIRLMEPLEAHGNNHWLNTIHSCLDSVFFQKSGAWPNVSFHSTLIRWNIMIRWYNCKIIFLCKIVSLRKNL